MVNFFYLSRDLKECARWHGDRHLHKMIVEYAQILSTVWHLLALKSPTTIKIPDGIYRKSHTVHPIVLWAMKSTAHYDAILKLALHLADERRRRRKLFAKDQRKRYKKHHATEKVLEILQANKPFLPDIPFFDPPKCMPPCYHYNEVGEPLTVIESYRLFYAGHKIQVAKLKWTPAKEPEWLEEYKLKVEKRKDIQQSIDERIDDDRKKKERKRKRIETNKKFEIL